MVIHLEKINLLVWGRTNQRKGWRVRRRQLLYLLVWCDIDSHHKNQYFLQLFIQSTPLHILRECSMRFRQAQSASLYTFFQQSLSVNKVCVDSSNWYYNKKMLICDKVLCGVHPNCSLSIESCSSNCNYWLYCSKIIISHKHYTYITWLRWSLIGMCCYPWTIHLQK